MNSNVKLGLKIGVFLVSVFAIFSLTAVLLQNTLEQDTCVFLRAQGANVRLVETAFTSECK